MVYNFTYYYNNRLVRETYTSDKLATSRFKFLVALGIPFKIITSTRRRNRYVR